MITKTSKFVKDTAQSIKTNTPKVLKKIRSIKGAGTVAKGLKFGTKWGFRGLKVLGAADVLAGGERTVSNTLSRIRKKPLKTSSYLGLGAVDTEYERNRIKLQNQYLKENGSLKGFQKWMSQNKQLKIKNPFTNNKKDNNKNEINNNTKETTTQKVSKNVNVNPSSKKKSQAQIDWEKETRNSPARKSGAFTDKQLWEQQKKHREWKKRNNRK